MNLNDSAIICLFISANFLSSSACLKEKEDALKLKKERGIAVVPIIVSACGWLDDNDISELMALPDDGKPVSSYDESNEGWNAVYNGIKDVIEEQLKIIQLETTESFNNFLQNVELLTKAHSSKEQVLLDDIFVYPELDKYPEFKS